MKRVLNAEALEAVFGYWPEFHDAEIVELREAGHMLPWDDLDGFVAAVREFAVRV